MSPAPAEPDADPVSMAEKVRRAPLALLAGFELLLYAVVAIFLIAAAGFILVGTVSTLTAELGSGHSAIEIGIVVLDRVLLTLIVAELAFTLRVVIQTHEIVAEPFLFIGLIAVVRRVLIVTGEFEGLAKGQDLTNLLYELGLLAILALALAASIYLVRKSNPPDKPENEPAAAPASSSE